MKKALTIFNDIMAYACLFILVCVASVTLLLLHNYAVEGTDIYVWLVLLSASFLIVRISSGVSWFSRKEKVSQLDK